MKKQLNYQQAETLRGRIADILQEMASFTDAEEDRIEDGAPADPEYIDALSDACLHLDEACIAMERIG
jgi:hypothetical protein